VRDGHQVTIAARHMTAAMPLAEQLGCQAVQMDREGDLQALTGYEVLVDAAGPFHAYGPDPYRLPRAAIASGLHYLDLSDNAAFCAGITVLATQATEAGRCVISGLSSVPALSSAAVRALAGASRPRLIDSAILPGNRSPRGLSVMMSILSQTGRPMQVFRGGAWQRTTGWSDRQTYLLPGGLRRQAWQIDVPDLTLFPAHFGAETVLFRAGLELGVMRYGLAALAMLRRWLPIPVNRPVVRVFKLVADLLAPFGSGRGGMSVMVIVDQERRWWRLLAENGDGPFIPAVPARALLRRAELPVGAGPALEVITLAEAEAAMRDLRVTTERVIEPFMPIMQRVLGPAFETLPEAIRHSHLTADVSRWHGQASVRRGTSLWSRLIGWFFGFPAVGEEMPVEVTKTVTDSGETWQRVFGKSKFHSRLAATPQGLTESFGPFTFSLGLRAEGGVLHFAVHAGRLGPLTLPHGLLPIAQAREYVTDSRLQFDVKLHAPLTGDLLVHYQGTLTPMTKDN
jgi:hypothetical protein